MPARVRAATHARPAVRRGAEQGGEASGSGQGESGRGASERVGPGSRPQRRAETPAAGLGPLRTGRRCGAERSACGPSSGGRPHAAGRRGGPLLGRASTGGGRDRGRRHVGVTSSLRAARKCADLDRGLAATSPGVGATARRVSSSASGSCPQTQIGQLGRADAAAGAGRQEALDEPVLERVERDRRQPPVGCEQIPGRRQRLLELGQLVVDRDPQRLERPAGRMAAGELRRHRHRGLDRVDQLLGGGQLLAPARPRDRAGDLDA